MKGIVLVWFSCVMFIHMGLADAVAQRLRVQWALLSCAKCLSFWSVLGYSFLVVQLPLPNSLATAFLMAYASLWADLGMGKIARIYEELSNHLESEAEETDASGSHPTLR